MAILPDWADVIVLVALGASIIINLYQFWRLRWYKFENKYENERIYSRGERAGRVDNKTIRIREHAGSDVLPSACYTVEFP